MNDWFSNAPNNAGINGVANSIQVLKEFSVMPQSDTIMLMPVLSLSNIQMLMTEIKNLGLEFQKIIQQWAMGSTQLYTIQCPTFQAHQTF
jgi:hypothetical protein